MSVSPPLEGRKWTTQRPSPPTAEDFNFQPVLPSQFSADAVPAAQGTIDSDDRSWDQPSKHGYALQRFSLRSILLVIVPPVITVYFIVISTVFVTDHAETSGVGHRNALVVYYSWFIIGVFGLGISRYGLAGVEAAMLQDRLWHANNAMTLLMHSGQSWAEFGGWIKYLFVYRRTANPMQPLWWLLTMLSLMVMIALPISGLTMEVFDGYVKAGHPPDTTGRTRENYLSRDRDMVYNNGYPKWQSGGSLRVPGAGVIYTPPHIDRQEYSYLNSMPNSLSAEQNVPEVLLIPQAEYPVSGGTAWGLRLGYNCSVVESASELTILSRRSSDFKVAPTSKMNGPTLLWPTDSSSEAIYSLNVQSIANIIPYVELGYSYHDPYYLTANDTKGNPGSDVPTVFEYALWQLRVSGDDNGTFNSTVTPTVPDLGSPFMRNATGHIVNNMSFFDLADEPASPYLGRLVNLTYMTSVNRKPLEYVAPIAVHCSLFSETGTASITPDTMTFTNFTPTPPAPPPEGIRVERSPKPFSDAAYNFLQDNGERWAALNDLFLSSTSPSFITNSANILYTHYLQPSNLHKAIMRAYAVDALALMYDGMQDFQDASPYPDLAASRPGKILGRGVVPAEIPAVLFAIWAAGCVALAVRYGFLRRWAETLDGYSFLRFGAEHAEVIRENPHREFYQSEYLMGVPGLVGDARVDGEVGHISLVEKGGWARRDKLYS